MINQFTEQQLAALRSEFAKIDCVNPARLSSFHAIFDKAEDAALLQLTTANVKFVSKLAVNAAIRRGLI